MHVDCLDRIGPVQTDVVDGDRVFDVLEGPRAHVLHDVTNLAGDVFVNRTADADAPGLGQGLETRRQVDTIAVNVVVLEYDLAQIHADAKQHSALVRRIGLAFDHAGLNGDGAIDGIDDTGKLNKNTIAHQLHDAALVLVNPWD